MKKRNSKRKGLLLAPDDLMVGKFIAVHSLKGSHEILGCFGMASEIRAINLLLSSSDLSAVARSTRWMCAT